MPSAAATQALIAIRGAISTLNNTSDVCADIDEAEDDLPEAFHEVAKTIPLVEHTFRLSKATSRAGSKKTRRKKTENAYQEITDVANECDARAGRLEKICGKVIPSDETPLMDRYRSAAGKGGRVELLMKGILEGVIALAKEPFVSEDQAKALREALKIISKLPPSLQEENGAHAFYNYGSGPQSIHLGVGDQNINTGQAPQFNGQFMAPISAGIVCSGSVSGIRKTIAH